MCEVLSGVMCAEVMGWGQQVVYLGATVNRDRQVEPTSVLKDFSDDALTISAGDLYQTETARTLKACCWWNL